MNENQVNLILHLIRSEALSFSPTQLKSGRISPYYISLRKAMDTGNGIKKVSSAYLVKIISDIGKDFDYIHGPAYAGIPLASSIALSLLSTLGLDLRYGYDRKEIKQYGHTNESSIIGDLRDGDRVLILDDVLTTGSTTLDSWKKLLAKGKNLRGAVVLVAIDREEIEEEFGLESKSDVIEENIEVCSILKISEILDWLLDREIDGKVLVNEKVFREVKNYIGKYNKFK